MSHRESNISVWTVARPVATIVYIKLPYLWKVGGISYRPPPPPPHTWKSGGYTPIPRIYASGHNTRSCRRSECQRLHNLIQLSRHSVMYRPTCHFMNKITCFYIQMEKLLPVYHSIFKRAPSIWCMHVLLTLISRCFLCSMKNHGK